MTTKIQVKCIMTNMDIKSLKGRGYEASNDKREEIVKVCGSP